MDRRGFLGACGAAALAGCSGFPAVGSPVAWRAPIDGTVGDLAVVGGRPVAAVRTGGESRLVAIGRGGAVDWELDLDGRTDVSLAAGGDTLYAGLGASGHVNDRLLAVDPGTGTVRWRLRNAGLPVVDSDTAYARVGDRLRAVAPGDGAVRWSSAPGGFAYPVAAVGDTVVTVGERGVLTFDARDGSERWRGAPTPDIVPVAVGDAVYVGADIDWQVPKSQVVAYDAATGDRRWRTELRGRATVPHAGDGLYVDVHVTPDTGTTALVGLSPDGTGWRLPGFRFAGAVDGGALASATDRPLLARLGPRGRSRWTAAPAGGSSSFAHAVVAGDHVVAVGGTRALAVALADGSIRWEHDAGGAIREVAAGGGRAYLVTPRGVRALALGGG